MLLLVFFCGRIHTKSLPITHPARCKKIQPNWTYSYYKENTFLNVGNGPLPLENFKKNVKLTLRVNDKISNFVLLLIFSTEIFFK